MKFALHSVSYSGTWGGVALPFEDFLDRAHALGYDSVEVMAKRPHVSPIDYRSVDDRKRLYDSIASRGLDVACIADYHDWCWDAVHGDMPHHEKELLWLQANCELAADLHCPYVRTFSGYLHPEVAYKTHWKNCVKYLKEGADLAQELGVTILLQPHQGFTMHYQDALRMLKEISHPNLQLQLDPPYVHRVRTEMAQAVEESAKHMRYTVLAGTFSREVFLKVPEKFYSGALWQPVYESWSVGLDEAQEDIAGFLSAMKENSYQGGHIGYEICSMPLRGDDIETLDDMAKRSLDYMKAVWESAA